MLLVLETRGTCVEICTTTFVCPSMTVVLPLTPAASDIGIVASAVTITFGTPETYVVAAASSWVGGFEGLFPRKDSIRSPRLVF